MRVDFYHLGTTPLERALPSIAEKLLAAGERLLVVADERRLEEIDRQLWDYAAESFLPHGRDRAEAQPVLLAERMEAANGARNVALADGVWRDEALGFERVFYFFDNMTIDDARAAWRSLKGKEEVEPRYWKQQGGRWVEGP